MRQIAWSEMYPGLNFHVVFYITCLEGYLTFRSHDKLDVRLDLSLKWVPSPKKSEEVTSW